MKKIVFLLFLCLVSSVFGADKMYGKGHGFIGAEVGFGGVVNFNIGVVGGYQYYFKNDWQFAGFRHGVRGVGSLDFAYYVNTSYLAQYNYNLVAANVGVDWTIEFTPDSKYNWGAFAGIGINIINGLNTNFWYPLNSIYTLANIGGSLNIDNTHRLEVSLGSGLSIISFRYAYMF